MDTDIISGLEAGMRTVLVATGATSATRCRTSPTGRRKVVDSIADVVPYVARRCLPEDT